MGDGKRDSIRARKHWRIPVREALALDRQRRAARVTLHDLAPEVGRSVTWLCHALRGRIRMTRGQAAIVRGVIEDARP